MAETANFLIFRGDDQDLTFTGVENGSVAGWAVAFTARIGPAVNDPPLLSVTGSILDAGSGSTPGQFRVSLTKAQTVALDPRVYYYSLKRTNSGSEKTLTVGKMTVQADIKNAA
jgi:hypothetical protein